MNNSVFGKTMKNIENRVDIKLVKDKEKARTLAAKPNYDHCTIFDEYLVAILVTKTKIYYNKPVYLGMCILDLSKTLMYDFHYNYMKLKYGDKAKLQSDVHRHRLVKVNAPPHVSLNALKLMCTLCKS